MGDPAKKQKIKVSKNGPYLVSGGVPLQKENIKCDSEGNSVEWEKQEPYPAKESYRLCRCGKSLNKPFCDGAHAKIKFDGAETAPLSGYDLRAAVIKGPNLTLQDERSLCAGLRFCHNKKGRVWDLAMFSEEWENKKEAISQTGKCLSGRLVAHEPGNPAAIEPEFEPSIAVVEDPAKGASGPLAVEGGIQIESEKGEKYEIRNRATLCRCGKSCNKPFCDASHLDPT